MGFCSFRCSYLCLTITRCPLINKSSAWSVRYGQPDQEGATMTYKSGYGRVSVGKKKAKKKAAKKKAAKTKAAKKRKAT
jgi:hypothetical protein